MIPDSFATQTLCSRDQLEAWREWYAAVFDVVPKSPTGDGFSGETRLWKLGGLVMSRTTAPPAHVARTRDHLRRDPADHGSSAIACAAGISPRRRIQKSKYPRECLSCGR
jgi:hypothetical protein